MKVNVLLFTEIMASLLGSGLSLQESLAIAATIPAGSNDRNFFRSLSKGVMEGKVLSEVIKEYENQFGVLYVSLIQIGEETGKLSEVFEKLTEFLKGKKETKEQILKNSIYPVLVLLTAILVVFVIVAFVFPRLEGILEAFGGISDELGRKIDTLETSIKWTGFIVSIICLGVVLVSILYRFEKKVRFFFDSMLINIPVLSKYIIYSETYDFAFSMKLLSNEYYPFEKSMLLSSKVIKNKAYQKSVLSVYEKVIQGKQIGKSFEEEKYFPEYLVSWIKIAEKNGNLKNSFTNIYEFFRKEMRNFSSRFSTILEPLFILITGLIVIGIIVQFVIPIFNMVGTL